MNDERYEIPGNVIHVRQDDDGEWEVWLNTEGMSDFSGVLIGTGKTRMEALSDADSTLHTALSKITKEAINERN